MRQVCLIIILVIIRNVFLAQTPSALTSVVSVSPLVIPVNGTATITVQLKDASGNNITTGGATVTFVTPISGTIGAVTDNNNGTYGAVFTAGATQTNVTITPKLGTTNFTNTSSVTVGSGYILDGTSGTNTENHTFSTNGNLSLSQGFFAEYLIVAGGGGGGGDNGGGGGAGGLRTNIGGIPLQLSTQNYPIAVGTGGVGGAVNFRGSNGGNSTAFGFTSIGGGGGAGGNTGQGATTGGSGGGGDGEVITSGANGTLGQGKLGGAGSSGGAGGGGGGAGSVGANGIGDNGGNGGDGLANNITGSSVFYSGGGGGGPDNNINYSSQGGNGGGGQGKLGTGGNGTNSLGGGGGGAGWNGSIANGGNGGSGVVIVRYEGDALTGVGGTVTTFTGNGAIGKNGVPYQVHTFNSSGNFNLSGIDFNQRLGVSLTNPIVGSGNLSYSGKGRLVFEANNTYSGTTTISDGTLQVGNGSATGSLGAGAITNNATLIFNRSNTYALGNDNIISGTGTVEHLGDGILDLGGINTHSCGTWILRNGSITNGTMAGNFTLESGAVTAVLGGSENLTKNTGGVVTLSSDNTYSGTTTLNAGTLVVNGTHANTTTVNVNTGATLKGNGSLGGTTVVKIGSTLQPGNSIGTLNFDNLTLEGGGNLNWEINDAAGTAGINWDQLNVSGTLNIIATSSSKFNINVWSLLANGANGEIANFQPTESLYSWTIINAGSITGFSADKFQINTTPINGTGGLISPYQVNGFKVVQQGSTIVLQYDPPAAQTIDGTNNGTETSNYTTTNTTGALTLDLGFFTDYLIVAGGGGGGGDNGGGGGAGGLLTNVGGAPLQLSSQNYTISVGIGGAGGATNARGGNGLNSSAFGLTSIGGGGGAGGQSGQEASIGGSGGGGSGEAVTPSAKGISGQGNNGGNGGSDGDAGGGGGGGAGFTGQTGGNSIGGNGGDGLSNTITGISVFYAGGGGGGPANGVNQTSNGGNGGGGAGKLFPAVNGTNGLGGGGGGAGAIGGNAQGASGGSGVVIIRYEGDALTGVGGTETSFTGNGTIGKNGVPYRVHTFNSSGNFNLSNVDFNARLKATLTGNIIGNGNLIYDSKGRLTLTGTNHTYTGTTTIQNGELRVNSNITSSASLTVVSGAVLSGTGTLPTTEVSGVHNPGTSPGVQTIEGDLLYKTGSTINWELVSNSTAVRGTAYDGVDVTGNLTFEPNTTLNLVFNAPGSNVDWTDPFWKTSSSGSAASWKLFDVTSGTIQGENSIVLPNMSTLLDKNGVSLTSIHPNALGFRLVKENNVVYLEFINANMWTGNANTNETITSNWSLNRTPITGEGVLFASNALNNLILTSNQSYRYVDFNSSNKKIILGNNDLTLQKDVIGANSTSYIQTNDSGSLKRSCAPAVFAKFDVGRSAYNPVEIRPSIANEYSVLVKDTIENYSNLSSIKYVDRTWEISRSTVQTGGVVDFKYYWNVSEVVNGPITVPMLNHYNGTIWEPASGSGSATGTPPIVLTQTGYSGSFSPFALTDASTPLPVEYLGMQAVCLEDRVVNVTWQTASEHNSMHFELYRSVDGLNWTSVDTIASAGTTTQLTTYSYLDDDRIDDLLRYYYLKQEDNDGKVEVFPAVSVLCQEELQRAIVFPNPAENKAYLTFETTDSYECTLYVKDVFGRVVQRLTVDVQQGANTVELDVQNLPSGAYFIHINQPQQSTLLNLLINR